MGLVLQGNIEQVARKLTTEEQILDMCVEQVGRGRVIVIEGAPGIGKSTLAWELCRKWEGHAGMEVYSLVILLRLREESVQGIMESEKLFYACKESDQPLLVNEVQNGKGILFVLDGFDELPESHQHKGVIVNLLRKDVLPDSTIIVTSRPSASKKLMPICKYDMEKRIEILGFNQESVKRYAASVFPSGNRKALKNFLTYISASENPAINSLMYVPLYAAFIVAIYREKMKKQPENPSLPHTLTELYTELCLTILNCHDYELETLNLQYGCSKLKTVHTLLLKLAHQAYENFVEEKIIFHHYDEEHFGFLDAVPELIGGHKVSFNFLHLTLQEFFAAYHISQLSDGGVKLFEEHGGEERWNVVWRFVAGLTQFRYMDNYWHVHREAFVKDNYLTMLFFQCLFEARSTQIPIINCAVLTDEDCTNLDYFVLGFCIANCSPKESSWNVTLYMDDSKNLIMFTNGLMTKKCSVGVITRLNLQSFSLEYLCAYANQDKSPLHSVTDLTLGNLLLKRDIDFKILSHIMPCLQKLCIMYCSGNGNFKSSLHCITDLTLRSVSLKDTDFISCMPNLQRLLIDNCTSNCWLHFKSPLHSITDLTLRHLSLESGIDCMPSLQRLHVDYCSSNCWLKFKSPLHNITDLTLRHLSLESDIDFISCMPSLQRLHIEYCSSNCWLNFKSPLYSITELTLIELLLESITDLTSRMPNIQRLHIERCTSSCWLNFLPRLSQSRLSYMCLQRTNVEYYLYRSPRAPEFCAAFQELLGPSSSLEELVVGPCISTARGTLIELIYPSASLLALSIGPNDKDNFAVWSEPLVYHVVSLIQHNATLEKLNLSLFRLPDHKEALERIAYVIKKTKLSKMVINFVLYITKSNKDDIKYWVHSMLDPLRPQVKWKLL